MHFIPRNRLCLSLLAGVLCLLTTSPALAQGNLAANSSPAPFTVEELFELTPIFNVDKAEKADVVAFAALVDGEPRLHFRSLKKDAVPLVGGVYVSEFNLAPDGRSMFVNYDSSTADEIFSIQLPIGARSRPQVLFYERSDSLKIEEIEHTSSRHNSSSSAFRVRFRSNLRYPQAVWMQSGVEFMNLNGEYDDILLDENGDLAAGAKISDKTGHVEVYARGKDGKFKPVLRQKSMFASWFTDFYAYHIDRENNRWVYLLSPVQSNFIGLHRISVETKEVETLIQPSEGDVVKILEGSSRDKVAAYIEEGLKPRWVLVDKTFKKEFDFLKKEIGGHFAIHNNSAVDGDWIVSAEEDTRAQRWFILHRRDMTLEPLFSEIDENSLKKLESRLRPMEAHWVDARDGLKLPVYLTLPNKENDLKTLIVSVHGGPMSRDHWGLNAEHQYFASRGYTVMSVNYRISEGLGIKHWEAGCKEHGKKIQQDLLDCVKWALKKGVARKDRVVIEGGSYGGYSSLLGVLQNPEVFAASIASNAPTDLSKIVESTYSGNQLKRLAASVVFGDPQSKAALKDMRDHSPISMATTLKRPTLLFVGNRDESVPFEHGLSFWNAVREDAASAKMLSYACYPDGSHSLGGPTKLAIRWEMQDRFLRHHLKLPELKSSGGKSSKNDEEEEGSYADEDDESPYPYFHGDKSPFEGMDFRESDDLEVFSTPAEPSYAFELGDDMLRGSRNLTQMLKEEATSYARYALQRTENMADLERKLKEVASLIKALGIEPRSGLDNLDYNVTYKLIENIHSPERAEEVYELLEPFFPDKDSEDNSFSSQLLFINPFFTTLYVQRYKPTAIKITQKAFSEKLMAAIRELEGEIRVAIEFGLEERALKQLLPISTRVRVYNVNRNNKVFTVEMLKTLLRFKSFSFDHRDNVQSYNNRDMGFTMDFRSTPLSDEGVKLVADAAPEYISEIRLPVSVSADAIKSLKSLPNLNSIQVRTKKIDSALINALAEVAQGKLWLGSSIEGGRLKWDSMLVLKNLDLNDEALKNLLFIKLDYSSIDFRGVKLASDVFEKARAPHYNARDTVEINVRGCGLKQEDLAKIKLIKEYRLLADNLALTDKNLFEYLDSPGVIEPGGKVDLGRTGITSKGFVKLLEDPRIRELSLDGLEFTSNKDASRIAKCKAERVPVLRLTNTKFISSVVEAICKKRNGNGVYLWGPETDIGFLSKINLAKCRGLDIRTACSKLDDNNIEDVFEVTTKGREHYVQLSFSDFNTSGREHEVRLNDQQLNVSFTTLTWKGIAKLKKYSERMNRMDLRGLQLGDEGIEVIAEFKALQYLDLRESTVSDYGLALLGQSITELKSRLTIQTGPTISEITANALNQSIQNLSVRVEAPPRPGPRSGEKADPLPFPESLAKAAPLLKIKQLQLHSFKYSPDYLKLLKHTPDLEELGAHGFPANAYPKAMSFPKLIRLRVGETDDMPALLRAFKDLPNLEVISTNEIQVNNDLLKEIARFKSLKQIQPSLSGVTDKGVAHLMGMVNLEALRLNGMRFVTDESVSTLVTLKGLTQLDITGTRITAKGLEILQQSLPNARINYDRKLANPRWWVNDRSKNRNSIDLNQLELLVDDPGVIKEFKATLAFFRQGVLTSRHVMACKQLPKLEVVYLTASIPDLKLLEPLISHKTLRRIVLNEAFSKDELRSVGAKFSHCILQQIEEGSAFLGAISSKEELKNTVELFSKGTTQCSLEISSRVGFNQGGKVFSFLDSLPALKEISIDAYDWEVFSKFLKSVNMNGVPSIEITLRQPGTKMARGRNEPLPSTFTDPLEAFAALPKVNELHLKGAEFNGEMLRALGRVTSVQKLTFERCKFEVSAFDDFAALKGVKSLYLRDCEGEEGNAPFGEACSKVPQLKKLGIGLRSTNKRKNVFTLRDIGKCQNIDELKVSAPDLDHHLFFKSLGKLDSLKRLSVNTTVLSEDACLALIGLPSLETLDITVQSIPDSLLWGMPKLKKLTALRFQNVTVTDALIAAVKKCTTLKNLTFGSYTHWQVSDKFELRALDRADLAIHVTNRHPVEDSELYANYIDQRQPRRGQDQWHKRHPRIFRGCESLRSLVLSAALEGNPDRDVILRSLKNLRYLNIVDLPIPADDLTYLKEIEALEKLELFDGNSNLRLMLRRGNMSYWPGFPLTAAALRSCENFANHPRLDLGFLHFTRDATAIVKSNLKDRMPKNWY